MLKNKKLIAILVGLILFGAILFHFRDVISLFFSVAAPESVQSIQEDKDFNVLLMGIGGGNHDGPNLTDTIMLANVRPSKNRINLISVPRDLWVPEISSKINAAYANAQDQGKGIMMSRAVIKNVMGVRPDYVVVLDFDGFVKLVDDLGGIDVNVVRTFDDYAYPITGSEDATCGLTDDQIASFSAEIASGSATELEAFPCRYQHVHFNKGQQHMDGETALEFVRSRHALGVEGTDFARSGRQEQVIKAIKQKVFSLGILLNPLKVLSIYNILKSNINTDIPVQDYKNFINVAKRMKEVSIHSYVIGSSDEKDPYGLLINPPPEAQYGYAWILAPRVGSSNFTEIQNYVSCIITNGNCEITATGIQEKKSATPSAEMN